MNHYGRAELAKARKLIEEAQAILDPLATEEQDKADRLPDGLRSSDQGQLIEEAAEHLGNARDNLGEALTEIEGL